MHIRLDIKGGGGKKLLLLTPAKLQAHTQAITPSFRPSPSYPL